MYSWAVASLKRPSSTQIRHLQRSAENDVIRTFFGTNMMDICVIDADGTDERHVLFHRNYDAQPAVSPDGTRIAFASNADGNSEIYIMNLDGSGPRRVTRDPADDEWPNWSPDGRKLYFSSNRDGRFALYQIDVP